jgi:hypothetical protein
MNYVVITVCLYGLLFSGGLGCEKAGDTAENIIELSGTFITIPEIPACDPERGEQLIKLPFLKNAWQLQENCELYDRDDTTWALITFYVEWKRTFGDPHHKVKKMINNIVVSWDHNTKTTGPIYTVDGKRKESSEVVGLCNSPTEIWVWVGEGKISHTALIHELVHSALWVTTNNPDSDHEGSVHPGWSSNHTSFIKRVNKILGLKYGF